MLHDLLRQFVGGSNTVLIEGGVFQSNPSYREALCGNVSIGFTTTSAAFQGIS
jgi:hypothetical protein